ncbi:MAG TPA: hypothetical protein VMY78_12525 [Solirubrobacteraceae bacterium]|nr:hypothetical protein [Solirubrobacteraceae bacterium]
MDYEVLPARMSLPEVMGDPCASELREHALALLQAAATSEKLIRSHPDVEHDLIGLRDGVERFTSAVLEKLASEAGIPLEGESISPHGAPMGDYRIDRSSECWIWMRSVTARGYPIVGRKANGRENVPAKIYWMLAHGSLDEHEIVVRTCNSRLCVNPDHARVTDRREHGAERMREGSALDWDAVREIRTTLCASRDGLRERAAVLANRFGVGEHSILDVFRNKVWFDPEYTPGFEVKCAGPGCDVVFRTTSTVRKYHSEDCCGAAIAARAATTRRSHTDAAVRRMSPERRARQEAALRAEAAAAEAEWSDVLADGPRTSVWAVTSLDRPLGDGGGALHDVLAAPRADDDPAAQLEHKIVSELLDGLTEEAVTAMDDADLASVRARLVVADVLPLTSRAVAM